MAPLMPGVFRCLPSPSSRLASSTRPRVALNSKTRLMRHLRKLRCRRIPPVLLAPPDEVDAPDKVSDADLMGIVRFGDDDESRVKRGVKQILECRKAASGRRGRVRLGLAELGGRTPFAGGPGTGRGRLGDGRTRLFCGPGGVGSAAIPPRARHAASGARLGIDPGRYCD